MVVLTRARARDDEPDPCCGCAGCRDYATHRLALSIGRRAAALLPLCAGHALAARYGDWAMQVEDDWGGELLDGQQATAEAVGVRGTQKVHESERRT